MHFDADGLLETFRPPTIQLGGRTLRGRILGSDEAFEFEERLQKIQALEGEAEFQEIRRILSDLARAIYPRPWWQFWRRPVWWHVERMPIAMQIKLFTDFSRCLAVILSPALGTGDPETTTTSESESELQSDT